MAGASLHRFYVMAPKMISPEFLDIMANPINYTQNSGFPRVISSRAMDYMKILQLAENEFFPEYSMYVMLLRGGVPATVSCYQRKQEHVNKFCLSLGNLKNVCVPHFVGLGTEKVPQRKCATKILPNVWANFLVRLASNPLFCWVMTRQPPAFVQKNLWCCSCDFLALWVLFWR